MNFIEEKIENKIKENNYIPKFRFPPEPNSESLHIGHAKAIVLNGELAKKYNTKLNLRLDDTNPLNEDENYSNAIIEDVKWLKYDFNITYASDYFGKIYHCAENLVRTGNAYVDFSTSEEIAELKGTPTIPGRASEYRSVLPGVNLERFRKMLSGEITNAVLRAKIDMSSPNMILRDPVIYRTINKVHPRKPEWKIFPTYDFAHPLSDLIENITDSLCTLEFEVHRPLYNWVIGKCKTYLNNKNSLLPEQTEFNRLNISNTVLSKRHIKKLIVEKIVENIEDPRLFTIKALRKRGYTPESVIEFCKKVGYTKSETLTDYRLLEACLREDLNKSANRFMGVMDPIKLTITNWDEIHTPTGRKLKNTKWLEIENNPEDENSGKRLVPFSDKLWIEREDFREEANRKYHRLKLGGEVRLKGAYVVKANDCIKDEEGNIVEVLCTVDPNSKSGNKLDRKVKGTIHWVDRLFGFEATFKEYNKLFNKEKVDINTMLEDVDKNSLIELKGYVEPECLGYKEPFQFMRKGYYILENIEGELNFIKSVSLKESNWDK
jgi:glutaminyl-tRNA synthetase